MLNLSRKRKVAARALVGYLVEYEGTNIFGIWIAQRRKVIRTRDVRPTTYGSVQQDDPFDPHHSNDEFRATSELVEEIIRLHGVPANNITGE
jgi:hypothetical protein